MTLPGQLGIILLFLDCIPLVDHGYLTQLQAGADRRGEPGRIPLR